jgi:hypothetical protein
VSEGDAQLMPVQLCVLVMFLPQLGPKITEFISPILSLCALLVVHEGLLSDDGAKYSTYKAGTQGAVEGRARKRTMVHDFLRHVYTMFPCSFVDFMRKECAGDETLLPKLEPHVRCFQVCFFFLSWYIVIVILGYVCCVCHLEVCLLCVSS